VLKNAAILKTNLVLYSTRVDFVHAVYASRVVEAVEAVCSRTVRTLTYSVKMVVDVQKYRPVRVIVTVI
jgi:hypothetical protein